MASGPDSLKQLTDGVDELKTMVTESLSATTISSATRDSVVELAALRATSYLETYFEQVFLLLLSEDSTVPSSGAVIRARSPADVDLLLRTSGSIKKQWSSWLPYDTLLSTADSYLLGNHTFSRLRYRSAEKQGLSELSIVRNAVAHPSDYAGRELAKLSTQRRYSVSRPADYLRSHRGGISEVLLLLTNVTVVASAIMAPSELEADKLLSAEGSFSSEQSGPSGSYECLRCQSKIAHGSIGKLGECTQCPAPSRCTGCGKRIGSSSSWRRLIQ